MLSAVSRPRPSFSLRPSKKTAILLGAIMGTIVVLTALLYWWQSGEIQKLQQEVDAKNAQATDGERTARELEVVRQAATLVDGKLRYLEQNVSFGAYVPTLLQQMEARARLYGLEVNSSRQSIEVIPPPPPLTREEQKAGKTQPPPPPYDRARLEMDLHGNYRNVVRFIHSLTHFEKIIAVNSVMQQSRQDKPGQSPTLVVRLAMTGYVFKDSTPPGTTTAAPRTIQTIGNRRAEERQVLDAAKEQPRK